MDQAKAFLADDKGVVSQVHLLRSKSDPLLAWDLETLTVKRGLVYDRQIRFPWAGLKGHNEAYIVIFTLSNTPTPEELAWKEDDLKWQQEVEKKAKDDAEFEKKYAELLRKEEEKKMKKQQEVENKAKDDAEFEKEYAELLRKEDEEKKMKKKD